MDVSNSELNINRTEADGHGIAFGDAVRTWVRIAALSFGGPAGQIAVMHRILVEEKRWVSETRFLHALNYCMLLPGPEAHELVIYIGWLLHRERGGIVAGVLFVLPGLMALSILSSIYVAFGQIGIVQGVFWGLQAAVLAVVLEAVHRVGRRALKSSALVTIAGAAFVAIFFFRLPFPFIIAAAALTGFAGNAARLEWFNSAAGHGAAKDAAGGTAVIDAAFARALPVHVRPSAARLARAAVTGAAIWLGPLLALRYMAGPDSVFTSIAAFNSKMAVVTFGGAYAVLAYMAQQVVEHYHWLKPGEMLVGLGFAETTPGPLISVVQFVGYVAAYRHPEGLSPLLAGMLGGFLAMWSTFVPPFIWIFMGGPYIEALIGNRSLSAALSSITAAVVGVILNLAIWFALHTLFARLVDLHGYGLHASVPVPASVNWLALALSLGAIVATFRYKIGMMPVFAACSITGALCYLIFGLP